MTILEEVSMKNVNYHSKSRSICFSVIVIILLIFISTPSFAGPVNKAQAKKAAQGWLKQNKKPMDRPISRLSAGIEPMIDDTGRTLCYIVNLEPTGFVITSTDDEIEPIIAFSSTGYYNGDPASPLTTLLKKDMAGRLAAVRNKAGNKNKAQKKSLKWQHLTQDDIQLRTPADQSAVASVSQVWVDPFVQVLWDQSDVPAGNCYNYYTPFNFVTGCVATAMAQVIRHHEHPVSGIGQVSRTIEITPVGGSTYTQSATTRGGNGTGGAYQWAQMPYDPLSGTTLTQRQAIGALCYDVGVTVEMSYSRDGSSASLTDTDQELTDTFDYSNSIYTQSFSSSGDSRLWNILNANLDAQLPVILGISRPLGGGGRGGHAVVADGYGYNASTLYHHINLGWGGIDNAWYQLPVIDAYYTYVLIDDCVYNIYTSGTGEIISGRITTLAGVPLENVTVRAYVGASLVKQTTTNARGIYALTNLASNTQHRISAEKTSENFVDQYVTTGTSSDWGTPGNRYGILFVSSTAAPPTALDFEVDVESSAVANIQLQVLDDDLPNPPGALDYIITSAPAHGQLTDPATGPIETFPYTTSIAAQTSGIDYTPCPYFGGQDTFTYKANDGGTYPIGGDSAIATVTVDVNDKLRDGFGTGSNTVFNGVLVDTDFFYDARSQIIYLPSEIGSAKRLTDLAIRISDIPGRTLSNWTIRMQHTNETSFPQNSPYEFLTLGWETVYQGDISITQAGWINFHFTTPFDYNGTQNLMIDLSFNNTGTTSPYGRYFIQDVSNNRVYSYGSNTGGHGDPLDWSDYYGKYGGVHSYLPSIKLIGVPLITPLTGDFDASCDVRFPDFAIFSQAWQTSSPQPDYNPDCDLTAIKGDINMQDLAILLDYWLDTY